MRCELERDTAGMLSGRRVRDLQSWTLRRSTSVCLSARGRFPNTAALSERKEAGSLHAGENTRPRFCVLPLIHVISFSLEKLKTLSCVSPEALP